MTSRVDVSFPELEKIGLGGTLKVEEGPKRCKHPHCGKIVEKLFDIWVHEDGARKCKPTFAEPEES